MRRLELRKPNVGLTWLHRYWLRLLLAGVACCLTSQNGPSQAPTIVNCAPAMLGSPQEAVLQISERKAEGGTLPRITRGWAIELPLAESDPTPSTLVFKTHAVELTPTPSTLVFPPKAPPRPVIVANLGFEIKFAELDPTPSTLVFQSSAPPPTIIEILRFDTLPAELKPTPSTLVFQPRPKIAGILGFEPGEVSLPRPIDIVVKPYEMPLPPPRFDFVFPPVDPPAPARIDVVAKPIDPTRPASPTVFYLEPIKPAYEPPRTELVHEPIRPTYATLPTVLIFAPSKPPPAPAPSVLVFEPAKPEATPIRSVLVFEPVRPPPATAFSSPLLEPGELPFATIWSEPVVTAALTLADEHPLMARPAFGNVFGLEDPETPSPNGKDQSATLYCPVKTPPLHPVTFFERPLLAADATLIDIGAIPTTPPLPYLPRQ